MKKSNNFIFKINNKCKECHNMKCKFRNKTFIKTALFCFIFSETSCSPYWNPDPMRPEHLSAVLEAGTLCQSIQHSRHASEFIRQQMQILVTNSPAYKRTHHHPIVNQPRKKPDGVQEKDAVCPVHTKVKGEKLVNIYTLEKIKHVTADGTVQDIYYENLGIISNNFDKLGYPQLPSHHHKKTTPTISKPQLQTPLDLWMSEQTYYPMEAARSGIEGYTTMKIWIGPQGKIQSVRFSKSSGSILLDNAAMGMFVGKTVPNLSHSKKAKKITVTIKYILVQN